MKRKFTKHPSKITASNEICYRDRANDDMVVALDVGMSDEDVEEMLAAHPSYYRSTLDRFDDIESCDKVTASEQPDKLSRYLGANLLMKFSAFLNVYGAEESDEFGFEESFDGSLGACLDHLVEYQKIIDDNGLDAYLSLEPWNGGRSFEGDLEYILTDLVNEGYITQEGFDHYYYGDFGEDSEVNINASTHPKYMANMVSCSSVSDSYGYLVKGYYDGNKRGLAEDEWAETLSDANVIVNEYANKGYYIVVYNNLAGTVLEFPPDAWFDEGNLNMELGEF